jgi:hypothetical protein
MWRERSQSAQIIFGVEVVIAAACLPIRSLARLFHAPEDCSLAPCLPHSGVNCPMQKDCDVCRANVARFLFRCLGGKQMLFPHCFESRVGVEGGVLVSCYSIAYVGASGELGDRSGVLKFSMGCMAEAQRQVRNTWRAVYCIGDNKDCLLLDSSRA